MNNYYEQDEDRYKGQGYYTNTYSLWQNSQYYHTNNFSIRNYTSRECKGTEFAYERAPSVTTDRQYRTILNSEPVNNHPQPGPGNVKLLNGLSPYGWSGHNWVKASDTTQEQEQGPSKHFRLLPPTNKLDKKLSKALKMPVKMTKAESMMQKMGWQGGALGKTGDGILVPIAPNAVYATTTVGFGHRYDRKPEITIMRKQNRSNKKQVVNPRQRKHRLQPSKTRQFNTTVLERVLLFVRNDFEQEIFFDKTLGKGDRKRVHVMVEEVLNSESPEDAMYADEVQTELLRQIHHYNCYVLSTQSYGEEPHRQLTLYKEAPAHVFLITPEDLRDTETDDDTSELELDNSNPFKKSITTNIKETINDTCEIEEANETCLDKLITYFEKFQVSEEFKEMRFLGSFNGDEIEAVNKFLNDTNKCIDNSCFIDVSERLLALFAEVSRNFQINEGVNGSFIIYKVIEE